MEANTLAGVRVPGNELVCATDRLHLGLHHFALGHHTMSGNAARVQEVQDYQRAIHQGRRQQRVHSHNRTGPHASIHRRRKQSFLQYVHSLEAEARDFSSAEFSATFLESEKHFSADFAVANPGFRVNCTKRLLCTFQSIYSEENRGNWPLKNPGNGSSFRVFKWTVNGRALWVHWS